ncbi:MAG: hypothetical protein V1664_03660 [Candidatus Uhrbacteria bacterium]
MRDGSLGAQSGLERPPHQESEACGLTFFELLSDLEFWFKNDLPAKMSSLASQDAIRYLKSNVKYFRNNPSTAKELGAKRFNLDALRIKHLAYSLATAESQRPNSYPNNEIASRQKFIDVLINETRTPEEERQKRQLAKARQKPESTKPRLPTKQTAATYGWIDLA